MKCFAKGYIDLEIFSQLFRPKRFAAKLPVPVLVLGSLAFFGTMLALGAAFPATPFVALVLLSGLAAVVVSLLISLGIDRMGGKK